MRTHVIIRRSAYSTNTTPYLIRYRHDGNMIHKEIGWD